MFYLLAFIIIIIFVINTWKTIKTLDYYKKYYQNKDTFKNTENFKNTKKDTIFRHKFLPHNYAQSSNYTLNLDFEKEQEIEEKNNSRKFKYTPNYPSSMLYNEKYFNQENEKYNSNPLKRPLNFNCQRQWFSQCG